MSLLSLLLSGGERKVGGRYSGWTRSRRPVPRDLGQQGREEGGCHLLLSCRLPGASRWHRQPSRRNAGLRTAPGTAERPAFPMEETRERGASGENENLSPSYFSGPSGGTKPRARRLIHGLALLRRGSLNIEWLCLGNVAFEIPSLDQEAPSDTGIMIIAYFAFR